MAAARDEIHSARNRQTLRRRRDAELGVAAAGHERADLVAGRPAADSRRRPPRPYPPPRARNVGGPRRRRIAATPLHDVGTIDAGGANLDQDVARAWRQVGTLSPDEHIGSPGFTNLDRNHDSLSSGNAASVVAGSSTSAAAARPRPRLEGNRRGHRSFAGDGHTVANEQRRHRQVRQPQHGGGAPTLTRRGAAN
jgi:hypothetical protein